MQGLAELDRVVQAGGTVLLLEHVRPPGRVLGWLADMISRAHQTRLFGFNLNRRTEDNVRAASLDVVAGATRRHLARDPNAPTAQQSGGWGSIGFPEFPGRSLTATDPGRRGVR